MGVALHIPKATYGGAVRLQEGSSQGPAGSLSISTRGLAGGCLFGLPIQRHGRVGHTFKWPGIIYCQSGLHNSASVCVKHIKCELAYVSLCTSCGTPNPSLPSFRPSGHSIRFSCSIILARTWVLPRSRCWRAARHRMWSSKTRCITSCCVLVIRMVICSTRLSAVLVILASTHIKGCTARTTAQPIRVWSGSTRTMKASSTTIYLGTGAGVMVTVEFGWLKR